jgi:hypothetical protein
LHTIVNPEEELFQNGLAPPPIQHNKMSHQQQQQQQDTLAQPFGHQSQFNSTPERLQQNNFTNKSVPTLNSILTQKDDFLYGNSEKYVEA